MVSLTITCICIFIQLVQSILSTKKMSTMNRQDIESPLIISRPSPPTLKPWFLLKAASITFLLLTLVFLLSSRTPLSSSQNQQPVLTSHGPSQGVSEKSINQELISSTPFPWTDSMLQWQRTSFHFQPQKNWMNGQSNIQVCRQRLYFIIFTFY